KRRPKRAARPSLRLPPLISSVSGGQMLLIAGLGNPGPTYARTRHNIGFMAVDEIARRWDFGPYRSRFASFTAEGRIETPDGPVRALLLKPQTFYNESGRAIGEALKFFKIE